MDNPLSKVVTNTPPPPPLEVKIRTMRSDIESMMMNGGGVPMFQDVAVSGLSMEKEYKPPGSFRSPTPESAPVSAPVSGERASAATDVPPASNPAQERASDSGSGNNVVPLLIVTLVAILAIGVVGYFAYTLLIR
jgi:hypothetical protein